MRWFIGLAALAGAAHVLLARSLSELDMVNELIVRQSFVHVSMAAALIGVRLFLVFVVPGALLAMLVRRRP